MSQADAKATIASANMQEAICNGRRIQVKRKVSSPTTVVAVLSLLLGAAGCDVSAPVVAVDEPDPELNFVRPYRNPVDECQLVGESAFTVDFLDDAADLVACPTGSKNLTSLIAETETSILTQTQSYSLLSVPRR